MRHKVPPVNRVQRSLRALTKPAQIATPIGLPTYVAIVAVWQPDDTTGQGVTVSLGTDLVVTRADLRPCKPTIDRPWDLLGFRSPLSPHPSVKRTSAHRSMIGPIITLDPRSSETRIEVSLACQRDWGR